MSNDEAANIVSVKLMVIVITSVILVHCVYCNVFF